MFLTLLVVAGNETTRNALTGGLVAFSRFPDQKDRLLAEPELIDTAVDEIVRYVSPVMSFCRTVTETHEYQGTRLEQGQKVLMLYQSANRDERVFDDPDAFRIDRDPNPHLGFGIGTHYCLGANLARAEIKVAFTELFARLRDIRVADDPGFAGRLVAGARHLPPPRRLHARAGDGGGCAVSATASPSRGRILDAALDLMSEKGVAGASMRSLAGACELNVATLYHHFPSKADVFRAVIEERGFAERFRTEGPPDAARWAAGRAAPAADRLAVAARPRRRRWCGAC